MIVIEVVMWFSKPNKSWATIAEIEAEITKQIRKFLLIFNNWGFISTIHF